MRLGAHGHMTCPRAALFLRCPGAKGEHMLDENAEQNNDQQNNDQPDRDGTQPVATTRARRRAVSRPAGPPKAVEPAAADGPTTALEPSAQNADAPPAPRDDLSKPVKRARK